jgi:hypothetical protein
MMSHISAVMQTLIIYLLIGAVYYGWGKAAAHLLGISKQTSRSDITLLWLGWAFTLVILQLSHFLFPLTASIVVPVFLTGVAFSAPQIVNVLRHFSQQRFPVMRTATLVIIMLAGASWIASRSMMPPTNTDSGGYHFNAIRWINAFPIVPGLGNLHGRLAFNQAFFPYAAALNFSPIFEHGHSLANSFLLLLTIVSCAQFLWPVLHRPSLLAEAHPFHYASVLYALPILVFLTLNSDGLASPTPDLASTLLQLMMFITLVQGVAEWREGKGQQDYRATVLAILAVTAITIKLSNLAFSAVIVSLCLACSWRTSSGRMQGLLRILVSTSVVLLVWSVRGFILSGCPLYPSTIGHVSVDWAVPIAKVVEEANAVYGYARQPNAHWRNALGGWEWFGPWRSRINGNIVGVVYPLVLTGVFCIIAVISGWLSFSKKRGGLGYLEWVILSPVVIGLLFWFFTAPDPRFAHALFWCLSLSAAALFLCSIQPLLKKHWFMIVMCGVFIIANLHFIRNAVKMRYRLKEVSSSGWHSIMPAPLIQKQTSSGLVVFTPQSDVTCWDSPLPCTPYFNPALRLRIPGKLASGFTVLDRDQYGERGHDSGTH